MFGRKKTQVPRQVAPRPVSISRLEHMLSWSPKASTDEIYNKVDIQMTLTCAGCGSEQWKITIVPMQLDINCAECGVNARGQIEDWIEIDLGWME